MNRDCPSVDPEITIQDFRSSGWKQVVTDTKYLGTSAYSFKFHQAATKAIEAGKVSHGNVLRLLANLCSMALVPTSHNEPFKPGFVNYIDGSRSSIPNDFTESDISFFGKILEEVDDPVLKSRLGDFLWFIQKPRDVRHARIAIDAYRLAPISAESWTQFGRECWERAFCLALMLKTGSENRLKEMEEAILAALLSGTAGDGFLSLWLANLLDSNALGRERSIDIAQKLESLTRDFNQDVDCHRINEYCGAARKWFKLAGNEAKAAEMTVAHAENLAKEAGQRASSDKPSHLAASSFYENAILTYRTIPHSERPRFRVDERISELMALLSESGRKALGEMRVITSKGIDIGEIIDNARESVRDKSTLDALLSFANIYSGVDVKRLRETAVANIRNHPFQNLFSTTVLGRDGRVVARSAASTINDTATSAEDVNVHHQMIRDYGFHVSLVVQGMIWPALEVMLLEHRIRESDFMGLASRSPIVPKGREALWGKALYAGYERDYFSAIHLLIPQIENLVRVHLKEAGAKTTNMDARGIENEIGLSKLMELPEAKDVFPENLYFEIRSLFCDPFGPNLRNELAHGLLESESFHSPYSVYAWWFGLRLVFNTFWNAGRKAPDKEAEGEPE